MPCVVGSPSSAVRTWTWINGHKVAEKGLGGMGGACLFESILMLPLEAALLREARKAKQAMRNGDRMCNGLVAFPPRPFEDSARL